MDQSGPKHEFTAEYGEDAEFLGLMLDKPL